MKYANYDDYISRQEKFAQPILIYLRECIHEGSPDIKEEFKWSFPNFTYKGSILAHMAGFKEHATFGFWLASHMEDPNNIFQLEVKSGMGQFGKIKSLKELPSKEILVQYIREAISLHDQGKKLVTNKVSAKKQYAIPEALVEALDSNAIAKTGYDSLSPSHKTEYIEWIAEAKTDATREKRLVQAILWLEEGKPRNWKYMKKWN